MSTPVAYAGRSVTDGVRGSAIWHHTQTSESSACDVSEMGLRNMREEAQRKQQAHARCVDGGFPPPS